MEIKQARIYNYGKWHNAVIPFRSGLTVLYGRNEAGKTTLLSFIRGVLFGFRPYNRYRKHYIPRQAKNYGGQLMVVYHHRSYVLERRSGKRGGPLKVMDAHGRQLSAERILQGLLGPIDRKTFNALFYFGDVDLKRVAKLNKPDLVHRVQKIGMADSGYWMTIQKQLDQKARKLYLPTGYRPTLNQKLKIYRRLVHQVTRAKDKYTDYVTLNHRLRVVKRELVKLSDRLKRHRLSLQRLNRCWNDELQTQRLIDLKPVAHQSLRSGFAAADQRQLERLADVKARHLSQLHVIEDQLHDKKARLVMGPNLRLYQDHRSLIVRLFHQLPQVSRWVRSRTVKRQLLRDVTQKVNQIKPKWLRHGKLQRPMTTSERQTVTKLSDQVERLRSKVRNLNDRRVRAEARINASHHQHTLFRARKLIPGVGLLTLDVHLIRSGDLRKSRHYQNPKRLYQRPKRFRIQVLNYLQLIRSTRKKLLSLGQHYHYSVDQPHPVRHWLDAQSDLRRLQDLLNQRRHLITLVHKLDSRLRAALRNWQFLWSANVHWAKETDQRVQQITVFIQHEKRAADDHQKSRLKLASLRKRQKKVKRIVKQIQEQIRRFYQKRRVKDHSTFLERMRSQDQLRLRKREYRKLSRRLTTSQRRTLRQPVNLKRLRSRVQNCQKAGETLKSRQQNLLSRRTVIKIGLQQLIKDGNYDRLRQRLANAQTRINGLAGKWLVYKLSSEWIDQTLNLANRGRWPKIERQTQAYFKILTRGHYTKITFSKGEITVVSARRRRFALLDLSKGTLQQLYLALVFALAKIFSDDYPMPILIDDGFTDFDVRRRKTAWRLLKRLGQSLQIIDCTSDDRASEVVPVKNLVNGG